MNEKKGLYGKYIIAKAETGEPIDGFAFVLRIKDPHARKAMEAYATSVAAENPELANDLDFAVTEYEEYLDQISRPSESE